MVSFEAALKRNANTRARVHTTACCYSEKSSYSVECGFYHEENIAAMHNYREWKIIKMPPQSSRVNPCRHTFHHFESIEIEWITRLNWTSLFVNVHILMKHSITAKMNTENSFDGEKII